MCVCVSNVKTRQCFCVQCKDKTVVSSVKTRQTVCVQCKDKTLCAQESQCPGKSGTGFGYI